MDTAINKIYNVYKNIMCLLYISIMHAYIQYIKLGIITMD